MQLSLPLISHLCAILFLLQADSLLAKVFPVITAAARQLLVNELELAQQVKYHIKIDREGISLTHNETNIVSFRDGRLACNCTTGATLLIPCRHIMFVMKCDSHAVLPLAAIHHR